MLTGASDRRPAGFEPGPWSLGSTGLPWSYRIAGAMSSWPAVEVYEAGTLLDVVTSTMLAVCVLRGARTLHVGAGRRAFAWGRLPLDGDLPAVEFRCRRRGPRDCVTPVPVTSWCWTATAAGPYDTVTVRSADMAVRRRLRVSRECR
jgi:hypothetical protein